MVNKTKIEYTATVALTEQEYLIMEKMRKNNLNFSSWVRQKMREWAEVNVKK